MYEICARLTITMHETWAVFMRSNSRALIFTLRVKPGSI